MPNVYRSPKQTGEMFVNLVVSENRARLHLVIHTPCLLSCISSSKAGLIACAVYDLIWGNCLSLSTLILFGGNFMHALDEYFPGCLLFFFFFLFTNSEP